MMFVNAQFQFPLYNITIFFHCHEIGSSLRRGLQYSSTKIRAAQKGTRHVNKMKTEGDFEEVSNAFTIANVRMARLLFHSERRMRYCLPVDQTFVPKCSNKLELRGSSGNMDAALRKVTFQHNTKTNEESFRLLPICFEQSHLSNVTHPIFPTF